MRTSKADIKELLSTLSAKGIQKVEVPFNGGNDEGFIESPLAYSQEESGKPLKDAKLASNLANPIWDKYGSFAGEFYVYGKLIWDVDNKKVYFSGEESSEVYRPLKGNIYG